MIYIGLIGIVVTILYVFLILFCILKNYQDKKHIINNIRKRKRVIKIDN